MQKATPSLSSGQASASQEEIAMFANVARNTVGTISKICSARGHVKPAYRPIKVACPTHIAATIDSLLACKRPRESLLSPTIIQLGHATAALLLNPAYASQPHKLVSRHSTLQPRPVLRRFRGLDIDPAYVDVAIDRWAARTGLEPRLEGSAS